MTRLPRHFRFRVELVAGSPVMPTQVAADGWRGRPIGLRYRQWEIGAVRSW